MSKGGGGGGTIWPAEIGQGSAAATVTFEPTGELAKDYLAFCEVAGEDDRKELVRGITEQRGGEEGREDSTVLFVRGIEWAMKWKDIVPLAKGIPFCKDLCKCSFVNAGLSPESLKVLIQAFWRSPSVVSVAIDSNCLEGRNVGSDPTGEEVGEMMLLEEECGRLAVMANTTAVEEKAKGKGGKGEAKGKKGRDVEEEGREARPKGRLVTDGFPAFLLLNLEHLSLRSNGLGCSDVEQICNYLDGHGMLLSLNLWGNAIGDAGAVRLGESLRSNTQLTALDLGHNNISDSGAKALADCFLPMAVTQPDMLAYRQRVRSSVVNFLETVGEEGVEAPAEELGTPAPFPLYSDRIAKPEEDSVAASSAKKKPPEKGKGSKGAEQRPTATFDRDVLTWGTDPETFIIPGNTTLWSLNLAFNKRLTDKAVNAFVSVFLPPGNETIIVKSPAAVPLAQDEVIAKPASPSKGSRGGKPLSSASSAGGSKRNGSAGKGSQSSTTSSSKPAAETEPLHDESSVGKKVDVPTVNMVWQAMYGCPAGKEFSPSQLTAVALNAPEVTTGATSQLSASCQACLDRRESAAPGTAPSSA